MQTWIRMSLVTSCAAHNKTFDAISLLLAFDSNSGQSRVESKWWGALLFSVCVVMEVLSRTGQRRLQDIIAERRLRMVQAISSGCHLDDQPITPCHGPLVVVADDEVVQRRRGGPHLKRTWWTEESIGTASGLWLQTGADGELLLPIVLSRIGGSKC